MELTISPKERDLLVRLLDHALSDLRVEARRTETPTFHDEVKRDEELLRTLLVRLQRS